MKNEKMRPYTVMCTDIYLLIMLVVFPLYYADGYFHLPERKAEFYSIATLIYVIVTLLGAVITAFSMREQWSWEALKKNITGTDICMFGFLISNLIALMMSNDVANSWTGKSSRYYGAKVLILVCVSYFLISRYAWINKVFITALLIGGNGVCLLATFDYFGMDVLGINKQMQEADWLIFISTMGNANTCASYVSMVLAGALVYFCVVEGKKSKIFAGISIVNCSAALITSRSDSTYVGIGVILLVLGVMAFAQKIAWKDYIIVLGLVDLGMLILYLFRNANVEHLIWGGPDLGISLTLNKPGLLTVLLVVIIIVFIGVSAMERKKIEFQGKQKMLIMLAVIIAIYISFIIVFLKLDIIGILRENMGMESEVFIGTRSYTYQIVIQAFGKIPLQHKIFGCGQASISSLLYEYYSNELSAAGISINSAHCHILDYLIMTGIFGIFCYLGALFVVLKHGLDTFNINKYVLVFVGSIIAYFAQGIFNIEQTNTTTIFWLMVACCEAMYRKSVIKKEN